MSTQGENNKLVQDFGLSTTRRQFVKGAAIAAPIIAAVSSRPVWANTVSAVSGNLSGNMSQITQLYDGCSPGFWHKVDRYPVTGPTAGGTQYTVNSNTAFNSIFQQGGLNGYTAAYSDGFTTIIHQPTNPATQVERKAAAVFMNSIADPFFPYAPEVIIDFYGAFYLGVITSSQAETVLNNLIHNGGTGGEANDVC